MVFLGVHSDRYRFISTFDARKKHNLPENKKIIFTSTKKIPINFTKEGWVEQNANLMIENIIFCIDCPRSTIWRNIIYDKYKQSKIKKDNFNSDIFDLFENYLNTNKFKTCKYEN